MRARIRADATGKSLDAYLKMLSSGSVKPPLELLKEAGVDLTKPTAVEAAAALFDKTITEIETLFEAK